MNSFDVLSQKAFNNQSPKPKVLGVGGSPRKNGNSDVLLDHILKGSEKIKSSPTRFNYGNFNIKAASVVSGAERIKSVLILLL